MGRKSYEDTRVPVATSKEQIDKLLIGKMQSLTDSERAWLACALDTEGSLTLNKWRRGNGKAYPQIRIYNTSLAFIERVAELTGAYVYLMSRQGFTSAQIYTASLSRKQVIASFLRLILPFLIIKKPAAQELLACLAQEQPTNWSEVVRKVWLSYSPEGKRQRLEKQRLQGFQAPLKLAGRLAASEDPFSGLRPALPEGKE